MRHTPSVFLLATLLAACGDDSPSPAVDLGVAPPDAARADAGTPDSGAPDASADAGEGDVVAPVLTIAAPRSGRMTPVRRVVVTGVATDETALGELTVGGERVAVEPDGSFTTAVLLEPGANALELHLTDAAGNATDETVEVYFGHRIGVGNSQAVALRDGVVHTWGRNELGQLGNGTLEGSGYGEDPETSSLPARYTLDVASVVSVVTRQTYMVALQAGGTVLTWGSNGSGQLGRETPSDCGSNGTSACGRTPEPVVGLTDIVAVQAGFEHTLVLHDDGTVSSFGSDEFGQLGRSGDPATPARVDGLAEVIQIAAGATSTYALTADGEVWAWGENDRGQLGLGTSDGDAHPVPTRIEALSDVVQIAASNASGYALTANGEVWAWGRNHAGQVGNGETGDDVLAPVQVLADGGGPLTGIENLAADGFVALASTPDGRVFAWGWGFLGQLGQGYDAEGDRDLENRLVASEVFVPEADREAFAAVEIEAGAGGPSLVLAESGALFGWGWSFRGSLGLEGAIDAWAYSAPVLVLPAPE